MKVLILIQYAAATKVFYRVLDPFGGYYPYRVETSHCSGSIEACVVGVFLVLILNFSQ